MKKRIFSIMTAFALVAGAMTSCQKDWTEDINKLQSDVSALSTQVSALDAQIKAGAVITNVAQSANGVTVTLSNGQTFNVTNGNDGKPGEAGKPGENGTPGTVVSIKDGEWYLNDEPTGMKVISAEDLAKAPFVNEEGTWVFYNEEGEEVVSTYKATPVVAVENPDGSYTLTVFDAEGNSVEVVLPTAASSVTDLILLTSKPTMKVDQYDFVYAKDAGKVSGVTAFTGTLPEAKNWAGPKTVTNGYIVAGNNSVRVQVNPTSVDASALELKLIDSKNNIPAVDLEATPFTKLITRAANANGLYDLSVAEKFIVRDAKDENIGKFWAQFVDAKSKEDKVYAVTTGNKTVRTAYDIVVAKNTPTPSFALVGFASDEDWAEGNMAYVGSTNGDVKTAFNKFEIDTWYYLYTYNATADEMVDIYDAHFVIDENDAALFGVETFESEDGYYAISISKTPDQITKAAFPVKVQTIDYFGNFNETTIWVGQTSLLNGVVTYDPMTVTISDKANQKFSISAEKMIAALGDSYNVWCNQVNVKSPAFSIYYLDKNGKEVNLGTSTWPLVEAQAIKTFKADGESTVTSKGSEVTAVEVLLDNSKAGALTLDTQYYLKAEFSDANGDLLNTVVVPVTFTAPGVAESFKIKEGYQDENGVINAYLYDEKGGLSVDITKYFSKYMPEANVSLEAYDAKTGNGLVKEVGKNKLGSADLATITCPTGTVLEDASKVSATIALSGNRDAKTGVETGYAEALTVLAKSATYNGWPYNKDNNKGTYKFQIRIASPIEQGTVKPVEGNAIVINGNDLVAGAKITDAMIKGYDYNGNAFNVVPDKYVDGTTCAWANPQLDQTAGATPQQDADKYIKTIDVKPATMTMAGQVNGYFVVKGESISQDVTVDMPVVVKDVWGYTKTVKVPVTIKKN